MGWCSATRTTIKKLTTRPWNTPVIAPIPMYAPTEPREKMLRKTTYKKAKIMPAVKCIMMPGSNAFSYDRVYMLPTALIISAFASPERFMSHMTRLIPHVPNIPERIITRIDFISIPYSLRYHIVISYTITYGHIKLYTILIYM